MGEIKLVDIILALILFPTVLVALPFVWVAFQAQVIFGLSLTLLSTLFRLRLNQNPKTQDDELKFQ